MKVSAYRQRSRAEQRHAQSPDRVRTTFAHVSGPGGRRRGGQFRALYRTEWHAADYHCRGIHETAAAGGSEARCHRIHQLSEGRIQFVTVKPDPSVALSESHSKRWRPHVRRYIRVTLIEIPVPSIGHGRESPSIHRPTSLRSGSNRCAVTDLRMRAGPPGHD